MKAWWSDFRSRVILVVLLGVTSVFVLPGCGGGTRRMEHAEDPNGQYKAKIAIARRVLEQNENWADRAEWEVQKQGNEWHVYAWRVEHPDEKGAKRYLPWGYSLIILDNREVPVHYKNKG